MQRQRIGQWLPSARGRLNEVKKLTWVVAAVCFVGLVIGLWQGNLPLFGVGVAALSYLALQLRGWRPPKKTSQPAVEVKPAATAAPAPVATVAAGAPPGDTAELVEQMLAQGRHALLLRPEIVSNLSIAQFTRAKAMLDESMALVPEGELAVGWAGERSRRQEDDQESAGGKVVRIERFYLDRYPITNRQFLEFVAGGGYEEMALWEPEIWPGILDFVDRTDHPGPAFWNHGQYEPGLDDHPVVGVSWYESAAYARWAGKRLPTGPEWEKAGSWPVQLSAGTRPQRKFPWGDFMDRSRTRIWGAGGPKTASIHECAEGVSVGGVYQLIGNVWEWTTGNFGTWSYHGGDVILPTPMKSIRGGAFDTYFDSQATCQFQSGEDPVRRKQNIGFRCALSVCDLALGGPDDVAQTETPALDKSHVESGSATMAAAVAPQPVAVQ